MFRPVAKIDHLFRMPQGKSARISRVPGIRTGCGVAIGEATCQRRVADESGPASIADRLELGIPSRDGQPNFDLDVRVAGRLQRCCNSAEWRKLAVERR